MSNADRSVPLVIGPEWDYLATAKPDNIENLSSSPPKKKCAIVATVRDEGLNLLEWIAHNRILGFDEIFIYSNDNRDGSDELLEELHGLGIINLTWNIADPNKIKIQPKVYRHAIWIQPRLWDFEWIAILDADEFIFPAIDGEVVPIYSYLAEIDRIYKCDQISLCWRWFSGNLEFSRKPGLLQERFKTSSWHHETKSIFKIRQVLDVGNHFSLMKDGSVSINCLGDTWVPEHGAAPKLKSLTAPLGQVNHYWDRSFQEYFIKRERGLPGSGGLLGWDKFFKWRRDASELSPYPDAQHVANVKIEMDRIMRLASVKDIVGRIESKFSDLVADAQVSMIYKDELARYNAER